MKNETWKITLKVGVPLRNNHVLGYVRYFNHVIGEDIPETDYLMADLSNLARIIKIALTSRNFSFKLNNECVNIITSFPPLHYTTISDSPAPTPLILSCPLYLNHQIPNSFWAIFSPFFSPHFFLGSELNSSFKFLHIKTAWLIIPFWR